MELDEQPYSGVCMVQTEVSVVDLFGEFPHGSKTVIYKTTHHIAQ